MVKAGAPVFMFVDLREKKLIESIKRSELTHEFDFFFQLIQLQLHGGDLFFGVHIVGFISKRTHGNCRLTHCYLHQATCFLLYT